MQAAELTFQLEKVISNWSHSGVVVDPQWVDVHKPAQLTAFALFIQENLSQGPGKGGKQSGETAVNVNSETKKRFLLILKRAISAKESVSRQERLFLIQFWTSIQNILASGNQGSKV